MESDGHLVLFAQGFAVEGSDKQQHGVCEPCHSSGHATPERQVPCHVQFRQEEQRTADRPEPEGATKHASPRQRSRDIVREVGLFGDMQNLIQFWNDAHTRVE